MTQEQWRNLGFNPWVAEALEGRGLSKADVTHATAEWILDEVFSWYGFIGFTNSIIDAVDNCRNMEAIL